MSQGKTMLADSKKTHTGTWVSHKMYSKIPQILCNSQYNVPLPAAGRRLIFYLVRSTLPIIHRIFPPFRFWAASRNFIKIYQTRKLSNLIVTSANALSSKHNINSTNPAHKGFLCKFFHDAMQMNILVTF